VQRFACLVLRRYPGTCEDESERVSLGWGGRAGSPGVLGADVVRFAVGRSPRVRALGAIYYFLGWDALVRRKAKRMAFGDVSVE
jgi:hypothetical protein